MTGKIPHSMSRALRQIRSHQAVRSDRVVARDGTVEVTVEIAAGLPSRWEAEGQSPSGVRAVEPVTFRFMSSYPLTPPRIFLRSDFNREHPHLQPGSAVGFPEPCLVMGSPAELLATRGIHGFIDQLVLWLQRAAQVELINPSQGWEPIRRDQLDHILVADADLLRSIPKRDSAWCVFNSFGYTQTIDDSRYHSLVAFRHEKRPAFPEHLLRDLVEAGSGATFTLVVWSGKNPDGTPFIADRYRPDTVATVAELHAFAEEIASRQPLEGALSLLQSRLRRGTVTLPIPIAVVLLARRPGPVIAENSCWEIIPYILEIKGRDDLSAASTKPAFPAMHRHALSSALLARINGLKVPIKPQWTLLGCGSVGSKIAIHLARAGLAPGHVVDKATMAPHNYARHGLLVQTVMEEMLPLPKAHLLANALKTLGQRATPHHIDILSRYDDLPEQALKAGDTALIVNSTGTLSAREALAAKAEPSRARLIETCLLAEGRIGYLALEGPQANPSAADLAAEFYRVAAEDSVLGSKVFASEPIEVTVGQGCSSITMNVTDAALSAVSAAMASQIQRWLAEEIPADAGRLLIGSLGDDGMGQEWQKHILPPWTVVPARDKSLSVRLSPHVCAKIEAQIAQHPGVETGGVLIGRWSDVSSAFHVVDVLTAPADSFRSSNLFVLGVEGLKSQVANLIRRTHGALYALGTWHNHLTDAGPSRLDRRTAHALAKAQHHPALLLIHTPARYRVLIAEAMNDAISPNSLTAGDQAA